MVQSFLVPVKIFSKYADLIKDVLLIYHLIVLLGGIGIIFTTFQNFSSVVGFTCHSLIFEYTMTNYLYTYFVAGSNITFIDHHNSYGT